MPQDDWGRCCEKTLDSTTFKRHSKSPDFGDGLGHTQPGPGKDERHPLLFNKVTIQYFDFEYNNALLLLVFVRYRLSGHAFLWRATNSNHSPGMLGAIYVDNRLQQQI